MNNNVILKSAGAAGFVLYMALLTILTAGTVGGFFILAAYNHSQAARRWHDADQCLLDAQSGLEKIKYELVQGYFSNQASGASALGWFQTWGTNTIGSNPVYNLSLLAPINDSIVTVTLANVTIMTNANYADVVLLGAASRTAPFPITRKISETLRIQAGAGSNSTVFDYAFFINNLGELSGANTVINGDVRANGDFTFSSKPVVNGNIYASGAINNTVLHWSQKNYWSKAMAQAPPTDPTDGSSANAWPMGYDTAAATKNANVADLTMPTIGDIEQLAASANGTVSQNGTNIVVNVYAGAGPDGIANTADDKCLVLNGLSSTKPIIINGAVVVKGDLIIRGYVAGQGTIYAGRNIHIVGGLSYLNPPSWPNPDSTPTQTAANNQTDDLLVLAAKGNIVVGDYTSSTWSNKVWSIMTDPAHIIPYSVDSSDAALGYDSDNNGGNGYLFNGRYYLNEANNGRRLSGVGTNTVARKFYESSLANASFHALCDAKNVTSINAALFSNHGIIGTLGSSTSGDAIINGAMACHDFLCNYYMFSAAAFTINWDIRLGSYSKEMINTHFMSTSGGTGTTTAITFGWKEIH